MKRIVLIGGVLSFLCLGCVKGPSVQGNRSGEIMDMISSFFDCANRGDYEGARSFFAVDPVKRGDISVSEFNSFLESSVTHQRSVWSVSLKDEKRESDGVRVSFLVEYADGTIVEKWVLVVSTESGWKLTTTGSLF